MRFDLGMLSVRDQIMTEELVRGMSQDGRLGKLEAHGWADTRAIIDDARDHAFHHKITVHEVLDLMLIEAQTGHTFQDWLNAQGRIVCKFCDS